MNKLEKVKRGWLGQFFNQVNNPDTILILVVLIAIAANVSFSLSMTQQAYNVTVLLNVALLSFLGGYVFRLKKEELD